MTYPSPRVITTLAHLSCSCLSGAPVSRLSSGAVSREVSFLVTVETSKDSPWSISSVRGLLPCLLRFPILMGYDACHDDSVKIHRGSLVNLLYYSRNRLVYQLGCCGCFSGRGRLPLSRPAQGGLK